MGYAFREAELQRLDALALTTAIWIAIQILHLAIGKDNLYSLQYRLICTSFVDYLPNHWELFFSIRYFGHMAIRLVNGCDLCIYTPTLGAVIQYYLTLSRNPKICIRRAPKQIFIDTEESHLRPSESSRTTVAALNRRFPTMPPDPTQTNQSLLQLHIAEYQMLTNRSTYYIYISTTIWSILLLFFAVMVSVHQLGHVGLFRSVWLICFVAEFSFFAWIDNSLSQYHNIYYIEHRLRPLIFALTNENHFWLHEHYLAEGRKGKILWWEAYALWASPIVLCVATALRIYAITCAKAFHLINCLDIVAFLAAAVLTFTVIRMSRRAMRLRRSFFPENIEKGA